MAHPSPEPPVFQNGVKPPDITNKSVTWNGQDEPLPSNQMVKGMNGAPASNLQNGGPLTNGDMYNGMKFISLASSLSDQSQLSGSSMSFRSGSSTSEMSRHRALTQLPFRAALHKGKQIPGRFFPSPSYTEFQRDVLESRPTPRKVVRKFKPKSQNPSQFPSGSPVKPRTTGEKSTWVANQIFNRGAQMSTEENTRPLVLKSEELDLQSGIRQYSIPATTKFHDGNNDALVTGSPKRLHIKLPSDINPSENGPVQKRALPKK